MSVECSLILSIAGEAIQKTLYVKKIKSTADLGNFFVEILLFIYKKYLAKHSSRIIKKYNAIIVVINTNLCLVSVFPDIVKDYPEMRKFPKISLRSFENVAAGAYNSRN